MGKFGTKRGKIVNLPIDGEKWLDICHSARPPLISGVYARQKTTP